MVRPTFLIGVAMLLVAPMLIPVASGLRAFERGPSPSRVPYIAEKWRTSTPRNDVAHRGQVGLLPATLNSC